MNHDDEGVAGGDRILRIVGVVIVLAVVAGVGVLVLAGANVPIGQSEGPDANFSISRVNDTYVRIVHTDGAPIAAQNLVVSVDGKIRHPTWSGDGSMISEGDGALLRIQDGQVVRIVWEGRTGERSLLDRARVG